MRIVLTGGVTGGHIYPAIAIGDEFRKREPDTEILFIGSGDGLEEKIVPAHGYEMKTVTAKWVDRSNVFKLADTLTKTAIGKEQAYRIIKKFKPDIVVSTGSYVSVPVVLGAHKYGAEIYLHEQNAYPGMANKAMAKYARRVFVGFRDAAGKFKEAEKTVYSGNPVRGEFLNNDRAEARKKLGIPEGDFLISAFGGSLGAEVLNGMISDVISRFGGKDGISIIFGTGRGHYDEVTADLEARGIHDTKGVTVLPYISDMATVIAASNLVISRAGALTVAEITVSGRASIFIPSPNVTADHQYYNAKAVADNGGTIIIREDEEAGERLLNTIEELMHDEAVIADMEKGSLASGVPNSAEIIYDAIKKDLEGDPVKC